MNKKMTIMAIAMVLCIACTVGVTFAYLTSKTETVKNTFSVGQVKITLDETDVDLYGVKDGDTRVITNSYKLIPGHSYTKDPTVHVAANSEACYVFVKVTNEIAAIEDGTTIAAQITNNWTALNGVDGVYYKLVDAATATAGTDLKVFGSFKIQNNADVSAYAGKTVTITAYAIQADGMNNNPATAWTNGGFN